MIVGDVMYLSSPLPAAVSMAGTPFFISTSLSVIMMTTTATTARSFAKYKESHIRQV